ncbi:tyrosine-type recombinase/integrase [Flavobacterium sp.]|uniref:tyrosine-type recombinase/integrase n=1 Tax=Flavobacterium sp. TaxID=239 RepID=UPI002B4B0F46|nr:tyrosine-type recombinase/integrase [Flavobacterium sp.]HLF52776.1 tyrosine-type recombinase/integrase [Flavobacterium sp.]
MKQDDRWNAVDQFRDFIRFRSGSENTAKHYGNAVFTFLKYFENVTRHTDITADQIIQYLLRFENLSTRRNAHSAIKLFYKFKSKNGFSNKFRFIPYPEKPDTIPDHITKEEFIKLMQVCKNSKHRCILMFGFDAGLRVSEVINLKITDLHFEKMNIHIRQSKGRKDRIIKFTSTLRGFLEVYFSQHNPQEYVFNGQNNEPQYSTRSCQQLLRNYCKKAGIKHYKFHALRHGYSMALYEHGYGLDTIGETLGHNSRKTTQIYARKNNKVIQGIESPLEQIIQSAQGQNLLSYV